MTSYNRVNGTYVADDGRLLSQILRGEWVLEGLVMTDWWVLASTVEAAQSGLDIEMCGRAGASGRLSLKPFAGAASRRLG